VIGHAVAHFGEGVRIAARVQRRLVERQGALVDLRDDGHGLQVDLGHRVEVQLAQHRIGDRRGIAILRPSAAGRDEGRQRDHPGDQRQPGQNTHNLFHIRLQNAVFSHRQSVHRPASRVKLARDNHPFTRHPLSILALRAQGWSYRQIGRKVGLHWIRVGQILKRTDDK